VNLAILQLLAQHESLAAEQIAAHLGDPLDAVNTTLRQMRDRGGGDGYRITLVVRATLLRSGLVPVLAALGLRLLQRRRTTFAPLASSA
jgi:hypothetical protein